MRGALGLGHGHADGAVRGRRDRVFDGIELGRRTDVADPVENVASGQAAGQQGQGGKAAQVGGVAWFGEDGHDNHLGQLFAELGELVFADGDRYPARRHHHRLDGSVGLGVDHADGVAQAAVILGPARDHQGHARNADGDGDQFTLGDDHGPLQIAAAQWFIDLDRAARREADQFVDIDHLIALEIAAADLDPVDIVAADDLADLDRGVEYGHLDQGMDLAADAVAPRRLIGRLGRHQERPEAPAAAVVLQVFDAHRRLLVEGHPDGFALGHGDLIAAVEAGGLQALPQLGQDLAGRHDLAGAGHPHHRILAVEVEFVGAGHALDQASPDDDELARRRRRCDAAFGCLAGPGNQVAKRDVGAADRNVPMLEVVFDRLVRLMSTSLRNFTSDNVEVSLDNITSIRFGDYLNSIPLPVILSVFRAEEWDNYGLITVDSALIYSIVDVLLGGRRGTAAMRIEGRPYTTIERNLVGRLVSVILADMGAAFEPLSPVTFLFDRLETNPRFATIGRAANAAILIKLRVDMEDRGGRVEILLPYATLEPVRELLLQMFMGEKFGRDTIWESHLATELWYTDIALEAVLDEQVMSLRDVMDFHVGHTIMLNASAETPVEVRCGGVALMEGRMGRIGDTMAIRIEPGAKPTEKSPT